jgi:hypothetical protein
MTPFDAHRGAMARALVTGSLLFVPIAASAEPSGAAIVGVLVKVHAAPGGKVGVGVGAEIAATGATDVRGGAIGTPFAQVGFGWRQPLSLDLGARAGVGASGGGCSYFPGLELQGELALRLSTDGVGYRYGGALGFLLGQIEVTSEVPFARDATNTRSWNGTTAALHGRLGTWCAYGRPVRDQAGARLPSVIGTPSARLEQARGEHSSVAEFVRLTRLLRALGAPGPMVRRSALAAEEEAGHAVLAYALAALESGRPVLAGPIRPPAVTPGPRDVVLADLRARSLAEAEDEALGAEAALEDCDAPGLAGFLARRIVREEREHADLGFAMAALT